MKRPLPLIFLLICAGIAAGQYTEDISATFIFAAASFLIGAGCIPNYRKYICILPFVIGLALYYAAATPPDRKVDSFADSCRSIKISGSVRSVDYTNDRDTTCFTFESGLFRLDKEYVRKKILIKAYCKGKVSTGDIIVISGELERPAERKNPSDFNRRSYMYARKQYYTINADKVWKYGNRQTVYTLTQKVKEKICDNFYNVMPQKDAALMCGMIMGDTIDIDENLSDLYKRTGIYHVLAISGLHIGLLSGGLLKLFSLFGKKRSRFFVMFFLTLYCIMTGCSVSVVRAVIMFYVLFLGKFISREYDLMSAASFTGCIILLHSPFFLFDTGFLFSFSAVMAIGAVTDLGNIYRKYRPAINLLGVNIAADLATKPVTISNFFYINPLSIFANFILIPLMSLCVAFGFLTAAMGIFSTSLSKAAALPAMLLLRLTEEFCTGFTSLPCTYMITGKPHITIILLYCLLLVMIYLCLEKGCFKNLSLYICALLFTTVCLITPPHISKNPIISFIDVGQGDCTVGTVDSYCFMVDGGSTRDSAGKNTILPYLLYRGIDKIDAVFISHTDKDHINGITYIIGKINVKRIYLPEGFENNNEYKELKRKALKQGVTIKTLHKGDKILLGNSAYMEVLYPSKDTELKGNNGSMVTRLKCPKGSVLFTGDIEKEGEQILAEENPNLNATILKLAHHGSKTSNTKEFIEKVNPRFAVASANSSVYGQPDKEVVTGLDKMGIPCYITEYTGEVSFEFTNNSVKILTYCKENFNE